MAGGNDYPVDLGFGIILAQPVELSHTPIIHSSYANPQKQKFLLDWVQEMLQKKAIIPVRMSASLGFYSRLFLVPKPRQKIEASNRFECIK